MAGDERLMSVIKVVNWIGFNPSVMRARATNKQRGATRRRFTSSAEKWEEILGSHRLYISSRISRIDRARLEIAINQAARQFEHTNSLSLSLFLCLSPFHTLHLPDFLFSADPSRNSSHNQRRNDRPPALEFNHDDRSGLIPRSETYETRRAEVAKSFSDDCSTKAREDS